MKKLQELLRNPPGMYCDNPDVCYRTIDYSKWASDFKKMVVECVPLGNELEMNRDERRGFGIGVDQFLSNIEKEMGE